MMTIRIRNLCLRTLIGVLETERRRAQDVVVNISLDYDGARAAAGDEITDAVDYQALELRVIDAVEQSSFHLLERLADRILTTVMKDPKVCAAVVEVDKPGALRCADSVSVTARAQRGV